MSCFPTIASVGVAEVQLPASPRCAVTIATPSKQGTKACVRDAVSATPPLSSNRVGRGEPTNDDRQTEGSSKQCNARLRNESGDFPITPSLPQPHKNRITHNIKNHSQKYTHTKCRTYSINASAQLGKASRDSVSGNTWTALSCGHSFLCLGRIGNGGVYNY